MAKFLGKSTIDFNAVEKTVIDDHVRTCTGGIDCHRDSYHAYYHRLNLESRGIEEQYCKFGVGYKDIDLLLDFYAQAAVDGGQPIELIILESTGPYSRPLFEKLAHKYPTCMVNPAEFSTYGKKTDKFDARKLSILAMQGLFNVTYLSSLLEEELKQLARTARKARGGMTRESNSLSSLLIGCGLGITRGEAKISVMSVSGQQILQAIIDGERDPVAAVRAAKYYCPDSINDSTARARGRLEKYHALVDALRELPKITPETRKVFLMKMGMIKKYERMHTECLVILRHLFSAYCDGDFTGVDALKLLETIPSISEKTGMYVLAETGLHIARRFGTPQEGGDDRFVSYAGLNPARQYSGDKETSKRRQNRGNKHLRTALIESGQSLLKSKHPLGDRMRSLQRRSGGFNSGVAVNIAVSAGANRLARSVYWVLLKREAFDDEKYDYTAILKEKARRMEKLLKDFSGLQEELGSDNREVAGKVAQRAASIISGCAYTLATKNLFVKLDGLFTGATLAVLERLNMRTFADVWALLSAGLLQEQAGIGKKRYSEIIQTCLKERLIKRVDLQIDVTDRTKKEETDEKMENSCAGGADCVGRLHAEDKEREPCRNQ